MKWNDTCSDSFPLLNGVKQGAVLSPILFTIYIDGLLEKIKLSGIGCHVVRTYAGAFGYADDVALLAPSLSGLKRMLKICKDYTEEYNILFNPTKFK